MAQRQRWLCLGRPARRTRAIPAGTPIGLAHSLHRPVLPSAACLALRRPARSCRDLGRPARKERGEDQDTVSGTALSAGRPCREGTGDGGGAAGNVQPCRRCYRGGCARFPQSRPGGGRSGCWCARRPAGAATPLPGGEPGDRVAAPLGIQEAWCRCGRSSVSTARSRSEKSRPGPRKRCSRTVRPGPALCRAGSDRHSCS